MNEELKKEAKQILLDIVKEVWDEYVEIEVDGTFERWEADLKYAIELAKEYGYTDTETWMPHPDNFEWKFWEYLWDNYKGRLQKYFQNYYEMEENFIWNDDELYEIQPRYYTVVAGKTKQRILKKIEKEGVKYELFGTDFEPRIKIYFNK